MDKEELKIMDYLDDENTKLSSELRQQAENLKMCTTLLRSEALEAVPEETDNRFHKKLGELNGKKFRNERIVAFVASIAALFILFYTFFPGFGNKLKIDLDNSVSNMEKLNYFHSLYEEKLNGENVVALNKLLTSEENPNVKVIILDLIDGYSEENPVTSNLLENLNLEDPPSVQMALLNILDNAEPVEYNDKLQAFSAKEGLDVSIKEKVRALLDKASPLNLNN